jgi:hypothetical protein
LPALCLAALAACGGGSGGSAGDTTPPAVIAVDPPDGAVGVALDAVLAITLSETPDPASVNGSVLLVDPNGMGVPGATAIAGRTVSFTPSAPLAAATRIGRPLRPASATVREMR